MAVLPTRRGEKRRQEARPLEAEQRVEEQWRLGEAKRLEAERRAEEERRLEEAARLEEERRTKEREEQERQRVEDIRRQDEKEAMRLPEERSAENRKLRTLPASRIPLRESVSMSQTKWIRETWQHEANDFTPWLGGHLELVSDCTGLELHHLGTEVAAAGGRADIVAWESKSKSKVVIENQIEAANTRHFQQLISYGEDLQAKIRIWIAAHFNKKFRRLIIEQNWKNESKPDGAIYYLLRIDRSADTGQLLLSLDLGPTQAQLERILFSQEERKIRRMLIDEFWSQYGQQRRRTRFSIDKRQDAYVSKSVDIGEARIEVYVRCHKGWRREQRQRSINSYANRLLADFPTAKIQKHWGYDEIERTLLDLRLSINLENLASWDEIGKWFSHIEEKVRNATFSTYTGI